MTQLIVLARQVDSHAVTRFAEAPLPAGAHLSVVDPHTYYLELAGGAPQVSFGGKAVLSEPTVVIPRLGSLTTEYALSALEWLERAGAATLNSAAALLRLRHKFSALGRLADAGLAVPDSVMLHTPSDVAPAVAKLGGYPVVVKFIRGSQGIGVVYAPDESVVASVLEALNLVQYDVMLQRYYPAGARRDLRVLVLGGEPRWAVARRTPGGGFRSNLHRGGEAARAKPRKQTLELAARAAAVFELGLAGVDIIESKRGPLVLEVNASPGFQAIELVYEEDIAAEILKYAASLAGSNASPALAGQSGA